MNGQVVIKEWILHTQRADSVLIILQERLYHLFQEQFFLYLLVLVKGIAKSNKLSGHDSSSTRIVDLSARMLYITVVFDYEALLYFI